MPGLNGFDRAASKEDRKHAKRYDAWFRSLPCEQQAKLREEGAGPYCEARTHDHVFPIYERAAIWAYRPEDERVEQDTFISREQVGRIVADQQQIDGGPRCHGSQMAPDRRQRGQIAGQQPPCGFAGQHQRSAWPADEDLVAELRLLGPGSGHSFTVQYEVDRQLSVAVPFERGELSALQRLVR